MKLFICVDDTDDLTKETSTGKISDLIAARIVAMGGKMEQGVTRHQLLLHEDIDYTSHNSSMCVLLDIGDLSVEEVKQAAEEVLRANMSAVSDPGLCFCRPDELRKPDKLIAFGRRAQQEVIQKEEAYELAEEIGGTILEEYGGTGIGVIGALAGVGLRLSGCDGTVRGGKGEEFKDKTMTVAQWKQVMHIEQVVDFAGNLLSDEQQIYCKGRLKLAFLDNQITLVAKEMDGKLVACNKKDLYENDRPIHQWEKPCDDFAQDNDLGECYSEEEKACYNCLYRRWTAEGYTCVRTV